MAIADDGRAGLSLSTVVLAVGEAGTRTIFTVVLDCYGCRADCHGGNGG